MFGVSSRKKSRLDSGELVVDSEDEDEDEVSHRGICCLISIHVHRGSSIKDTRNIYRIFCLLKTQLTVAYALAIPPSVSDIFHE